MGIKKTFIRTLLYQAGRARSKMGYLVLSEEQMNDVNSMLMEANEAIAASMSKRQGLSACQLIYFSCVLSAAILKLVMDVWGENALCIYKSLLEDQWEAIKDKDMNVLV